MNPRVWFHPSRRCTAVSSLDRSLLETLIACYDIFSKQLIGLFMRTQSKGPLAQINTDAGLLSPGGSARVLQSPSLHGNDDRAEVAPLVGQQVVGSWRTHRIETPLDNAMLLKRPQ